MGAAQSTGCPGAGASSVACTQVASSYCAKIPHGTGCHSEGGLRFICTCEKGYYPAGILMNTTCKKTPDTAAPDTAVASFVESDASPTASRLGKSGATGTLSQRWLWGLGGFGVGGLILLLVFLLRFVLRGRKTFSKGEKEPILSANAGETTQPSP